MRISVFWGHGCLTDRSISNRYLKSDIATWVEKSSTSRVIHARDTGFYWSSVNALHERFIASSGVGVWMKTQQPIAKQWKNASVLVWIQLNGTRENLSPPTFYWEWSKDFYSNNISSTLDCAHWREQCACVVTLASVIALYMHGHTRVPKFHRNASILVCRATAIRAIQAAPGSRHWLVACASISYGRSLSN